jgi:very-short-patch-repair endonuclease
LRSTKGIASARQLRAASTDAERRLWGLLRSRRLIGFKFRRQHPVGPYVLDFACIEHRLAVEADGSQHIDSEHDRRRADWLSEQGWRIIRFWNADILRKQETVIDTILAELGAL